HLLTIQDQSWQICTINLYPSTTNLSIQGNLRNQPHMAKEMKERERKMITKNTMAILLLQAPLPRLWTSIQAPLL
ncbi:hypothetical protein LINPERPRIM_LOCUS21022, partial [Linum perenne]